MPARCTPPHPRAAHAVPPGRLRINSNRENSHLTACPDNPDRDLPTVCNQNFSNHCAAPTIKVSSACATTLPSTEATASPTPIGPLWRIIFVSRRSLSPGFTFPLKRHLLMPPKKCNFSLILVKRKNRNRTDLRQRLDNQHARHHRLLRKMARKKNPRGTSHIYTQCRICPAQNLLCNPPAETDVCVE